MLATEALHTLAREDMTPKPSPCVSTDTEAVCHVHRLCMQTPTPDPDALRRTVLDIMAEAGHGHLLPLEVEEDTSDEGSVVEDLDPLPPMTPSRRIIIETTQRMQPESPGLTAAELLNPSRASRGAPRHEAVVPPTGQTHILTLQLLGWQMDASRNQWAQLK